MKQPNNIRNRWRRYREARIAYDFTHLPFRQWAVLHGQRPEAYAAKTGDLNEPVSLIRGKPKRK